MKKKMHFTKSHPSEILAKEKHAILNFQNLYSVYLYNNEPIFRRAISSPGNIIFPDGKILSIFLKSKQMRGPAFTKDFFENNLKTDQKHFFILEKAEEVELLKEKFPKLKKTKAYAPSYVKSVTFPTKEIKEMQEYIEKFKPDYIWVCVSNPKQEILANELYKKYKTFYFNVGAATDFLIGKKFEAPKIFRSAGLEWFYRLATDFKYSKNKVKKSLIGLRYLKRIKIT